MASPPPSEFPEPTTTGRRRFLRQLEVGAVVAGTAWAAPVITAAPASAQGSVPGSVIFESSTPGTYTVEVPAGTAVDYVLAGGRGGDGSTGLDLDGRWALPGDGGRGAQLTGTIAPAAATFTLTVVVASNGVVGNLTVPTGGSGGGASSLRAEPAVLVVAPGGGGGGGALPRDMEDPIPRGGDGGQGGLAGQAGGPDTPGAAGVDGLGGAGGVGATGNPPPTGQAGGDWAAGGNGGTSDPGASNLPQGGGGTSGMGGLGSGLGGGGGGAGGGGYGGGGAGTWSSTAHGASGGGGGGWAAIGSSVPTITASTHPRGYVLLTSS